MQVRVMGTSLSAAQKLGADAAAAQQEAAVHSDKLAAKKVELVATSRLTALLQSISAGTAGAAEMTGLPTGFTVPSLSVCTTNLVMKVTNLLRMLHMHLKLPSR